MKVFSVVFLLLFVCQAQADIASDRARFLKGIGKVVVCEGQRPILLDYYEGIEQYQLKLNLPKSSARGANPNLLAKAKEVFKQLLPIHKVRTAFYYGFLEKEFAKNSRWLKGFSLHQGDVDTAILLKPGCKQDTVLQLSIRGDKSYNADPDDISYTLVFNTDILEKMDELNQVMTIIHAVLAWEGGIFTMAETPHPTRLYVAMLLSDRIRKMSHSEFVDFINEIDYINILDLVGG